MNEPTVVALPLGRRALPAPGQVELWVSDLADFPLVGNQVHPGWQERRQALKFRQRFLLRLLLGSYLDCPGKDVRFRQGAAGKPELIPELALSGLQFNLSHSGDWLAIAVARDAAVGVDIECRRELPRAGALAKRFFSRTEAQCIADLAEPARSGRFLALWSRREALIKTMGARAITSLGHIELDPACGQPVALPTDWPAIPDWTLLEPGLPSMLIGALAVAHPRHAVETMVLEWRSDSLPPGQRDRLG